VAAVTASAWRGSAVFHQRHALAGALGPAVHEALACEVVVEQRVNAPVRRLLADEAAHLGAVVVLCFGRQRGDRVAYGVDEELLAEGEAHRQGIEESGRECIATTPVTGERRLQVDQEAANNEFGHGRSSLGKRTWFTRKENWAQPLVQLRTDASMLQL
jgi:hypothetical protein